MSKKLYLNSGKAKAKIDYKNRGRMKLTIKFSQDEAQALKNWTNQVKPPQLDEDTFYKQVFFNGIGALNQQLAEMAKTSLKDESVREQLRQAGVDVERLESELYGTAVDATADQPMTQEEKDQIDPAAPVEVTDPVEPQKTSTTQDATDSKN